MKARVTICIRADGAFELLLNEAGRDLMVKELQSLSGKWDHFHLDHYEDPDIADATDVVLSAIPYRKDDTVIKHGKILLRPDDWDEKYFPHVLPTSSTP